MVALTDGFHLENFRSTSWRSAGDRSRHAEVSLLASSHERLSSSASCWPSSPRTKYLNTAGRVSRETSLAQLANRGAPAASRSRAFTNRRRAISEYLSESVDESGAKAARIASSASITSDSARAQTSSLAR